MFYSGVILNENETWNETVWVLNQILNETLSEIFYDVDFWTENGYLVFVVIASHCNEFYVVNESETLNDDVEIWNVNGGTLIKKNKAA